MVTLEELATAVSIMRTTQKQYFKRRTQSLLNQAKDQEKVVDDLLTQLAPGNVAVANNIAQQTRLFE